VPADSDGDLLCDAVDADDDNDGWSDIDEVECGSDPTLNPESCGGCAEATLAHAELKQALRAEKDTKKLFEALRKAVEAHESDLRAFAGL